MRLSILAAALAALISMNAWAGDLSGRRAPGFSLPDSNLRQYDLQDYRGKVVLIDIMLTNCPHCLVAARTLEAVKAKYAGRVVVLSVVNPPDTTGTVQEFVKDNKVTYPVLFDCGQMSASYLKITPQRPKITVPHLFVIDPQGTIADDFAYSPASKEIFEGKGLYPILDRLLSPAPAKK